MSHQRASAGAAASGRAVVPDAPPRRVGIIVNPRSHANGNGWTELEAVAARFPGFALAVPADAAELSRTLEGFAAAGIDLLVVSGGDGTLRDVLSALPGAYPTSPPDVAILAAGDTNLAARALGSPGNGRRALERLLAAAEAGRLRRRSCPILQVSWVGQPDRRPVRGFLLGAAAFVEAKGIAEADIHGRGLHRGPAVILAAAATAARALFGGGGTMLRGTPMQVGVDSDPPREGRRFLLLATTLDRLMLGLWPFWGGGIGRIRLLDIDAPPPRLAAALLAVALRRPRPWMEAGGYRSGRADEVRVRLDEPFLLDGERFDAGPDGVLLSAPGTVTVVFP